jgi:hypothetical protein
MYQIDQRSAGCQLASFHRAKSQAASLQKPNKSTLSRSGLGITTCLIFKWCEKHTKRQVNKSEIEHMKPMQQSRSLNKTMLNLSLPLRL